MVVRRAEIKDIEKINELLLQVAMVHHYGRPDLFKANCRKYKNDELVEIIKDDNRPIFVAEDDGVVIGYAFCVITDRKDDNVLTDMKNFDAMNVVYEQQFSAPYPTRTTVGVTGLCGDALIEIELIAKK